MVSGMVDILLCTVNDALHMEGIWVTNLCEHMH